jgi:hypothetical protein
VPCCSAADKDIRVACIDAERLCFSSHVMDAKEPPCVSRKQEFVERADVTVKIKRGALQLQLRLQ